MIADLIILRLHLLLAHVTTYTLHNKVIIKFKNSELTLVMSCMDAADEAPATGEG